jgi:hypothetical protein
MRVPWQCGTCGSVNLIDLLGLESRPVDKIISARGFVCGACRDWQVIFHTSISFDEMSRKLARYTPGHEQYKFLLKKLMRKAISMAQRNGEA